LPHEFNFGDIHLPRESKIYFSGMLSKKGRNENYSTFKGFIKAAKKNRIKFISNDPFLNPLSEEEVVRRTQASILGVDIRGPEHIRNGYVPCRVFKSISWGHLGMTNSPEVFRELEGNLILNTNSTDLFSDAMLRREDYSFILNAMKYVQSKHTYVNRIEAILSIL
jgi:deoxyribodipyrimidine photolyase